MPEQHSINHAFILEQLKVAALSKRSIYLVCQTTSKGLSVFNGFSDVMLQKLTSLGRISNSVSVKSQQPVPC